MEEVGTSRFKLGEILSEEKIRQLMKVMDAAQGSLLQEKDDMLRREAEEKIIQEVRNGNFPRALDRVLEYSWPTANDDDFQKNLVRRILYLRLSEVVHTGRELETINKVLEKMLNVNLGHSNNLKELFLKTTGDSVSLPRYQMVSELLKAVIASGITEEEYAQAALKSVEKVENSSGITYESFMVRKKLGLLISNEYAQSALNVADDMLREGDTMEALTFYVALGKYMDIGKRREIIEAKDSKDKGAINKAAIRAEIRPKPALSWWRRWVCTKLGAYD